MGSRYLFVHARYLAFLLVPHPRATAGDCLIGGYPLSMVCASNILAPYRGNGIYNADMACHLDSTRSVAKTCWATFAISRRITIFFRGRFSLYQ